MRGHFGSRVKIESCTDANYGETQNEKQLSLSRSLSVFVFLHTLQLIQESDLDPLQGLRRLHLF